MTRLIRTILLLAVTALLALPGSAVAKPPIATDTHHPAAGAVIDWLERLWQPIADWFHGSPPEELPPLECADTGGDQAETDGGPDIDPNG